MGKGIIKGTERCPNCGWRRGVTMTDIYFALAESCGARTSHEYPKCHCKNGAKPPRYVNGNTLTKSRANEKGGRWPEIYAMHNKPLMRDCRTLGYRYAVGSLGDIVAEACGDYWNINNEFEGE